MCGNGVTTGMTVVITAKVLKIIPKAPIAAAIEFCVAVPGATMSTAAGWRIVIGTIVIAAAATSVFVS